MRRALPLALTLLILILWFSRRETTRAPSSPPAPSPALAAPLGSDSQPTTRSFRFASGVIADFVIARDVDDNHLQPSSWQSATRPNHDSEGQNVMFNDGHIAIEGPMPFVGANHDQIYIQQDSREPSTHRATMAEYDTVLLPWDQSKPSTPPATRAN